MSYTPEDRFPIRIFSSDDYQEFNTGHLSELKKLYENKLETVQQDLLKRAEEEKQQDTTKPHEVRQAIDSTKKEYRVLIEQNHLLKDKLGKYTRLIIHSILILI